MQPPAASPPPKPLRRTAPIPPVPELDAEQEREVEQYLLDHELTPKELLFVEYYTGTLRFRHEKETRPWNATAAARAAGYAIGSEVFRAAVLLKKPAIRELIEKRLRDQLALANITAARTLRHYAAIAYSDPGEYFREDGSLRNMDELPEDARLAIQSIESEDLFEGQGEDRRRVGQLRKIKFWDKTKGLDSLRAALDMAGVDLTVRHIIEGDRGDGNVNVQVNVASMGAEEIARLYHERVRSGGDSD